MEWTKCFYAVNIDMVGKKGVNGIVVTQDVSDSNLVKITQRVCEDDNYKFFKVEKPVGSSSDYASFQGQNFVKDFRVSFAANLIGALIPQRSYFTEHKNGIPIINFADDMKSSTSEFLSIYSPVAFGEIHSYRDNTKVVDPNNLVYYHNFFKKFLLLIDKNKSLKFN